MKNSILVFMTILVASSCVYSQSSTCYGYTSCSCSVSGTDTTLFSRVPMGLGIDTGGAPNYLCYDCSSLPINLPFNFCFYGKEYNTVYISNKGDLSFGNPDFTYSSKGFPAGDTLMLAAFWSDIDTRTINPAEPSPAAVYYSISPTHMVAQWNTVPYGTFDHDNFNNFQITITNGNDPILPSGNNVAYSYWLMEWTSGNPNEAGFGFGQFSFVGVNKGDGIHYAQFGSFGSPYYNYYGPYDTNSELYWLDNQSFIFNTCVNGNNIPPVIVSPAPCNTIFLCPGDTTLLMTSFLCAQQGQTATLSVASNITGLINTTSNANSIYSISTQLIPNIQDTGTHIITVIATDNGTPALKDSLSYTVVIYKNCADTGLGVNKITGNTNFLFYPNPNNGIFHVNCHFDPTVGEKESPLIIKIYDVLGEQVLVEPLRNIQGENDIDMPSKPSGIYFYRIVDMSGDLLRSGKFVIQ